MTLLMQVCSIKSKWGREKYRLYNVKKKSSRKLDATAKAKQEEVL